MAFQERGKDWIPGQDAWRAFALVSSGLSMPVRDLPAGTSSLPACGASKREGPFPKFIQLSWPAWKQGLRLQRPTLLPTSVRLFHQQMLIEHLLCARCVPFWGYLTEQKQ